MKDHNTVSHRIITYVDDTQHLIAAKSNTELKVHNQDLHELLIAVYKHKSLHINGNKTEFLNFSKVDKDDAGFTIKDEKTNIIKH